MNFLNREGRELLFTQARTHHAWSPKPVEDAVLKELYELAKWGPTSLNAAPARILFIKTDALKEKLYPALMGSNVEQVRQAPVTAIIAQDMKFYEKLPELMPAIPNAKSYFEGNEAFTSETALRNSSLQGAYLLMAARALGLDTGPMSGFDSKKVDEAFFSGTSWKTNFIMTLGYGEPTKLYPRGPRLSFDEVCKIA